VRRFGLVQLGFSLRRRLLDRAPLPAEKVEIVGDSAAEALDIEYRVAA
jgi:hypothetical protein